MGGRVSGPTNVMQFYIIRYLVCHKHDNELDHIDHIQTAAECQVHNELDHNDHIQTSAEC